MLSSQWVSAFNPFIGLAINAFIQVLAFRLSSSVSLLKSIFLGFFSGQVIIFVVERFAHSDYFDPILMDFWGYYLANVIIYSFLGYGYYSFIGLGETARRSRILRELAKVSEGLSMEEILEKYNAKYMLDIRLSRLFKNGQVILKNGRYFINKPTVLYIAKLVLFMKQVTLGKGSEFD
jgi:hypothetical protein